MTDACPFCLEQAANKHDAHRIHMWEVEQGK